MEQRMSGARCVCPINRSRFLARPKADTPLRDAGKIAAGDEEIKYRAPLAKLHRYRMVTKNQNRGAGARSRRSARNEAKMSNILRRDLERKTPYRCCHAWGKLKIEELGAKTPRMLSTTKVMCLRTQVIWRNLLYITQIMLVGLDFRLFCRAHLDFWAISRLKILNHFVDHQTNDLYYI